MCILATQKCNGKSDCPLGEDEEDCKKEVRCPVGHSACDNGDCIPVRIDFISFFNSKTVQKKESWSAKHKYIKILWDRC